MIEMPHKIKKAVSNMLTARLFEIKFVIKLFNANEPF